MNTLSTLDRSSAIPGRRREGQTGSMARPGVVLQPIVDLASVTVWGQEALCRVPHSPFRYLVAGGGSSLPEPICVVLEARMLRAALDARARVHSEQLLTVNVSPTALVDDEVQRVLDDHASLDGVMVELTEYRDPEPIEGVVAAVQELRDRGALIALDDVGGGRGALRYARALEPDLLKLDGDVIGRVHLEPMKRVMVESALAVARDIDAQVVAEGIESTRELDAVLRLGIRLGQGFLLGQPTAKPSNVSPHVRRWLRARADRLAARTAVARGPHIASAS
jgi:EAL domain-containing protein (putative c-di-GMP-specific phosphodiesterase class I)